MEIPMSDNEIPQADGIENLEIQPLSDEALEDVAGGAFADADAAAADGSSSCCSCSLCS
jgi:hypothetical protein